MSNTNISVLPYGHSHVLVYGLTFPERLALIRQAEREFVSARAGIDSVLVEFSPYELTYETMVPKIMDLVSTLALEEALELEVAAPIDIPVVYDGADLSLVSDMWSMTTNQVSEALAASTFQVALLGFAPGFPYLQPTADSPILAYPEVPRLDDPRTSVPRGAVGIAAGMACVYPQELPGGWHLVGRTSLDLFDVQREVNPALLSLGQLVRLTPERER